MKSCHTCVCVYARAKEGLNECVLAHKYVVMSTGHFNPTSIRGGIFCPTRIEISTGIHMRIITVVVQKPSNQVTIDDL